MGLLMSAGAMAKSVDLAAYRGTYGRSGICSVFIFAENFTFPGTSSLRFNVSRNGKSGTLTCMGSIIAGDSIFDVGNVFGFSPGRVLTIARSEPILSEVSQVGVFAAGRNGINGIASDGGSTQLQLSVKLRQTRRRAKITVVYSIVFGGFEMDRFTYVASRRLKPEKD